jgi:hypothetical protein
MRSVSIAANHAPTVTSSPWLPEEDDRSQVDEQSSSSPHSGLYRVADAEVSLNTKKSMNSGHFVL